MAFTTTSGRTADNISDSAVYRVRFEIMHSLNLNDYLEGFQRYLQFEEKKDYALDTLMYLLSRLTDNYHFLFLVISGVFAYFMLRSLTFFAKDTNYRFSLIVFPLIILFLHNHIFNINGIRFWTTYWIAVYTIFQILIANKTRYWLLAALTPFLHIAYTAFVCLLLLFRFIKNRQKLLISYFVVSVFLGFMSLTLLERVGAYFPAIIQEMITVYTTEEAFDSRQEMSGIGAHIKSVLDIMKFVFINVMVYLFVLNKKEINNNVSNRNLLSFILLWVGTFNIFMGIPSLGVRFITLAFPLVAYLWLRSFGVSRYRWIVLFIPIVLFWDLRLLIASFQRWLNIDFLYTNPVFLIYQSLLTSPL